MRARRVTTNLVERNSRSVTVFVRLGSRNRKRLGMFRSVLIQCTMLRFVRRVKPLVVLILLVAGGPSCAHVAHLKGPRERPSVDDLAAIAGTLAFDTLGGSQQVVPGQTRWFAADTLTYRTLQPFAAERGLRIDVLREVACPWNTNPATRTASASAGFQFAISMPTDSSGHFRADIRMGCRGPVAAGGRPSRGSFATGIVVELVKSNGKWRVAKVIDRWIT